MDGAYLGERQPKRNIGLLVIVIAFFLVIGGVLALLKSRKKIISPLPTEPSFELIFYTPTPGVTTPTSTPSATPKVKRKPTNTPKPSPKKTPKPSPAKPSPTPAKKISPTPTG